MPQQRRPYDAYEKPSFRLATKGRLFYIWGIRSPGGCAPVRNSLE